MMDNKRNSQKSVVKKGRFNAVDLLLILLILVIIGSLLLVFDPFSWISKSNSEEVTLRYTVEIKNVSNDLKNNIASGDKVLNASTGYDMGTVVAIETQSSFEWVYNEGDDYMSKKYMNDKSDIIVTIDVKAVYEADMGYMVDAKQIAVGVLTNLRFPSFTGSGYCISIEKIN